MLRAAQHVQLNQGHPTLLLMQLEIHPFKFNFK